MTALLFQNPRFEEDKLQGIVEAALDEANQRHVQVSALDLRLGALSGVMKDALLFSYEVASRETPLEGSYLVIEEVPVVVFCARSNRRRVLESLQSFTCPDCGAPAGDVLEGKELEVFGLGGTG